MPSISIVVIESPPGSDRARSGIGLAAEQAADIALIGAASAPFARKGALRGFCGTAIVGRDAIEAAGIAEAELEKGVRVMSGSELDELIADAEVLGRF